MGQRRAVHRHKSATTRTIRRDDQLWAISPNTATGPVHEKIGFDYTNGVGEPIHPDAATSGIPATAVVRNLASEARQVYARQLYCLMLLLVDDGYAETPNMPFLGGNNLNLELYLQAIAAANNRLGAPNEADWRLAVTKLTARKIAQWAINAVDFRDADSITCDIFFVGKSVSDRSPFSLVAGSPSSGILMPFRSGTPQPSHRYLIVLERRHDRVGVAEIDRVDRPLGESTGRKLA